MGDLNVVRDGFARFNLLDEHVRFLHGAYDETLPEAPIEKVALLRMATVTYEDTFNVLDVLYAQAGSEGLSVIVESVCEPL